MPPPDVAGVPLVDCADVCCVCAPNNVGVLVPLALFALPKREVPPVFDAPPPNSPPPDDVVCVVLPNGVAPDVLVFVVPNRFPGVEEVLPKAKLGGLFLSSAIFATAIVRG